MEKAVANVSLYGPISAGTDDPELAYQFLRCFLLGKYQWENYLGYTSTDVIEFGWLVLKEGSWENIDADLLDMINLDGKHSGSQKLRNLAKRSVELTADDFSILDTEFLLYSGIIW